MAAALLPREMANWSLTSVALGALEGGLLGIIVKSQFAGVASPVTVNIAVAVVAAVFLAWQVSCLQPWRSDGTNWPCSVG
jgi:hypothetical protein